MPGRPKTDKRDAVWLAKLTEKGLLRSSFVPPAPIRQLRLPTHPGNFPVRQRIGYAGILDDQGEIGISHPVRRYDSLLPKG
ncbi:putative transposase [Mycobacterium kansasii 662]|uniref:Transposase n=3 Tax=Mycobacterium kansasii TaxID=1768 RepID=A0A653EF28_MYCKA|nr:hypothetical protein MKAN_11160 [Mycobacterium kansasii ATCC 12478]ETZ97831.1 putative transposase [Mycobacterium kansasii 824]EUA10325.1 putative transposase [Mycobacterium kansasii 662]KEP41058.1 hypothetical protein MKSMC1_37950 [Mycobacterium kansasii]VAZ62807.1 hypothetical protein LAUMK22_04635 [Mycobacterium kansasii]